MPYDGFIVPESYVANTMFLADRFKNLRDSLPVNLYENEGVRKDYKNLNSVFIDINSASIQKEKALMDRAVLCERKYVEAVRDKENKNRYNRVLKAMVLVLVGVVILVR